MKKNEAMNPIEIGFDCFGCIALPQHHAADRFEKRAAIPLSHVNISVSWAHLPTLNDAQLILPTQISELGETRLRLVYSRKT